MTEPIEQETDKDALQTDDADSTEIVDGQKTQKDQETKESDEDKDTDSKDGVFKSMTRYIKDKLKSSSDSDDLSKDEDSSLADTDIPDEFSNAAESLKWSGEDIIKFASEGKNGKPFTNEELLEMVPELLAESEEPDKETDKESDKKTTDLKSETQDSDKETELRDQIKKELIEELGLDGVKDMVREVKEKQELDKHTALVNSANDIFDEASKTFKVFGLTKDLPKYPAGTNKGQIIFSSPAFKARAEVYDDAVALMEKRDLTIDVAMKKALNIYKGAHLEDDVRRKTIKDLKKHEKHLSGSRTSKEVKKTHQSERDEDIDYIKNLQRAAGQDV